MNALVIAEHRQVRFVGEVEPGFRALIQWMDRLTNEAKELP